MLKLNWSSSSQQLVLLAVGCIRLVKKYPRLDLVFTVILASPKANALSVKTANPDHLDPTFVRVSYIEHSHVLFLALLSLIIRI